MTKEEIAKKAFDEWIWIQNSDSNDLPTLQDIIEYAMQEYAEQETERLKAELNELKEKHKKDVMKAYIDADPHFLIEEDAEQYYKQKFESND